MPTPRRLLLVATDTRLTVAAQSHLLKAAQVSAPAVRADEVPHLLTPEADGDLLLVAADPADAAALETVVREARVQQLPARMAVLETEAVRAARCLDHLDAHLVGRWVWPHQSRELTAWAARGRGEGAPFPDPAAETVADKIRRRLVNHTPSLTAMVDQLCIAAAYDVTVLIEGETGTGKTFLAKLVHDC